MVDLDGRVVLITGGGRGLGYEHAALFSSLGARLVINDLGGTTDGNGSTQSAPRRDDISVAQQACDEIIAKGGEAVANTDSVADFAGAGRMIAQAVAAFGRLDVVVSNAGILRDKMLVNMTEEEFDAVIAVHLKGSFNVLRNAAGYWRERSKELGAPVNASVIQTSSGAGLFNNVGQANYSPAKAAIASLSQVAAKELGRYGVRVNTIAPMARTRLTEQTPGLDQVMAAKEEGFDIWHPGNVSPLVAYLASADCPITGGVFQVVGDRVDLTEGWSIAQTFTNDGRRWTVEELDAELKDLMARRSDGDPRLLSEAPDINAEIASVLGIGS